jgi:hypothetical protein
VGDPAVMVDDRGACVVLICLNALSFVLGTLGQSRAIRAYPMPKVGMKAVLTMLALNRSGRRQPDWDRIVIVASTVVTIGLIALYAYGKATARW